VLLFAIFKKKFRKAIAKRKVHAFMVRMNGLEPLHACAHQILSFARTLLLLILLGK
jgi:hypothetical protein